MDYFFADPQIPDGSTSFDTGLMPYGSFRMNGQGVPISNLYIRLPRQRMLATAERSSPRHR
eukprot:9775889-Alexandrium_andersonii.AAC.1